MAGDEAPESPLGAFIRRQREVQDISLRQLAQLSGISNPYLSQIERGLREPSEKVLGAIARNLEISAEVLQDHDRRRQSARGNSDGESAVVAAIRTDRSLTPRQRSALLEVYHAFTRGQSGRRDAEAPRRNPDDVRD